MFTGLIEHLATLHAATPTSAGLRLEVDALGLDPARASVGASIAIDGCCLTVATQPAPTAQGLRLAFDVIPQTLALTTLASLRPGDAVHLEPALRMGDALGGHILSGHIDGVGTISTLSTQGEWRARVDLPKHLGECLLPQGSIALAGVSLTIASCDVRASWVEVALIPTTLRKTTLGRLAIGSRINVECDAQSRQIASMLRRMLERS